MNQEKIQELVSRSRVGDMNAFSLLVSELQPLMFRLAFRLLCDEDEAKDVVQDTFVKMWLALDKYNGECLFTTWLYKITCNTCYDRLRSLRNSSYSNDASDSCLTDISSDDNIEDTLSNKQLKELILHYAGDLPPKQKLIFTLRDLEELDVSEVELITGLSAGVIKSTLYLARKNIRNKMNQKDLEI